MPTTAPQPEFHCQPGQRQAVPPPVSFPTPASSEKEPPTAHSIRNVFSVDVEDWPMGVLGSDQSLTDRVVINTDRCLEILRDHGVRATFFVLSKVAERFPRLVERIAADGHEIASHGHGHALLTRLTPAAFECDVRRSVEILSNIVGSRPVGYRAPAFSIIQATRWAGPILSALGFRYSSSIFPIRHRRYGIPDAPRGVHRWPCGLIECPPATMRLFGTNLPIAGGGYHRLLPGSLVRAGVARLNRAGMPAILYMHPYELDVRGVAAHRRDGRRVSAWRGFTQSLFRSRIESRLRGLFERFPFQTLGSLLDRIAPPRDHPPYAMHSDVRQPLVPEATAAFDELRN